MGLGRRPAAGPLAAAIVVVTAVALVFGAFAGSAGAKKPSKSQKAKIRASLRKQVKKNPGVLKRRSFLRTAALVNFKLPVTIRLRNPCSTEAGQNPVPNASPLVLSQGCHTQGTALNQRTVPSANVNLGPSLGTRSVVLGGGLAAVVEFNDTYDGGALGNVNIKILPGNKTLTTSSVPLLWNDDIADISKRRDANALKTLARPGGLYPGLQSFADGPLNQPGCGDWTTAAGEGGAYATAPLGPGYKAPFHDVPENFGFGTGSGLPGWAVYTPGGVFNGVFLAENNPGADNPNNIQAGAVVGSNDWIGPNPNPFPSGSAPGGASYNARNTVLRTNALSLGIAAGGVSVNMSTGTPTTPGGLTTAQGSQDVTLGYSGGQANLFGNIPGKNVGIDVTVNLATKINSIVRVMDQDHFKFPGLIEGEEAPATTFNCRQLLTGAVQNYIPGVRLTGSLRIAPAITKDGKVRIAKATVQSDVNNPDRVALSACLFPAKPYLSYAATSTDTAAVKVPTLAQAIAGGANYNYGGSRAVLSGNTSVPLQTAGRYPNLAEGNAPSTVPCGADTVPELADIIRKSALTGTVSGLPTPTDPAYAGVTYRGDQASVAGDITVNPLDVDVLLGDQSVGTSTPAPAPPPVIPSGTITEYAAPGTPIGITDGPDGNLWFTEAGGDRISKITTSGTITGYALPNASSWPNGITEGPDGNLWFTELSGNRIGKITTSGTITEYTLPNPSSQPFFIAAGPDGNLWFTEIGNRIGKITTSGTITEYTLPNALSGPVGIAAGPDGNLWFTERDGNRIGKITTSGTITEYTLPNASSAPYGITAGPDGNLWFPERDGNRIGKITTSGTISEYTLPNLGSQALAITAGPDGNLWFTQGTGNRIGKITTSGTITEYPLPNPASLLWGITTGPDGNLWFAEAADRIGKIAP